MHVRLKKNNFPAVASIKGREIQMKQIIITYGAISGTITIVSMILGIVMTGSDEGMQFSMWLGYLIMLVALSMIFIGIKQYRDRELGGVITFARATMLGLGITIVAGIMYVVVWEIYLVLSDYAFINDYTQSIIAAKEAAGASGEELAAAKEEMAQLVVNYANPLFRLPMTFLEILPVGVLISLISAAILRNSNVMPVQA